MNNGVRYNLDDWGNDNITNYSLMIDYYQHLKHPPMPHPDRRDIGLHLTLPFKSYRHFLANYFKLSEQEIYSEWDRQFKKMEKYFVFNRVDSHWGTHFFPKCWRPLMALMKKYKIKYVRNPERKFCWFHWNPKVWLGRNKSWLLYKINKMPNGIQPLPYKEIICHIKSD